MESGNPVYPDEENEHTIKKWKLEEMQDHKQRKECIEMNVKAVAPFHVLPSRRLHNQVSVHHKPGHNHNKHHN